MVPVTASPKKQPFVKAHSSEGRERQKQLQHKINIHYQVFHKLQTFLRERHWTLAHLFRSKRINKDQSEFIDFEEFHSFLHSETFVGLEISEADLKEIFEA